ncbi:MAG: dihydrofolate reductase [Proteobacteria bacterium]|nr:dihydrofolate reductase [Pseudomonadota bacterium]
MNTTNHNRDKKQIEVCQIVCMTSSGVIGSNGQLPWHIPEDLAKFKGITMGSCLIMGRKTWQSLPGILPGRAHVIMSRSALSLPNHQQLALANTVKSALEIAKKLTSNQRVFVIGGSEIYQLLLPWSQKVYVTEINDNIAGDTFYPIAALDQFRLLEKKPITLALTSPKNNDSHHPPDRVVSGYDKLFIR